MPRSVHSAPHFEVSSAPKSSARENIGIEAQERLRRCGYSALRDISCDVHGQSVRLAGRLPSYYLKQVAQAVVAEIEGVRRVINLIEVAVRADRLGQGRGRTSWAGESIEIGHGSQS
ncbi:MAG: putative periplasmic or secreted lipoprotein [Planctomycetota bacterium]|nr:putative periplasmic or secreted lipoprotein [Planctomycetota bacterium]